jgi:hypothetical protein
MIDSPEIAELSFVPEVLPYLQNGRNTVLNCCRTQRLTIWSRCKSKYRSRVAIDDARCSKRETSSLIQPHLQRCPSSSICIEQAYRHTRGSPCSW